MVEYSAEAWARYQAAPTDARSIECFYGDCHECDDATCDCECHPDSPSKE